jgi:cell division transport system ATP-binding protein
MIQFLSVSKTYDDNLFSLRDLSFEVQDGEFVFLVGPSGSGKTSIIKLLIREEVPTTGRIFFEDEDVTRFNRSKVYQLRRRIGVIFQDFKLINELNAYENIAFAMEAAGKPEREIKDNVPYLLDIVGLSHRGNSFPYQLSGGEKQRVAIARAMANNPRLLIADEPTGNLDPETAWDIAQILYKINNWGTTVIMSTHGSDIVNSMHKRVIRLQDGSITRDDFKGSYDEVDEFSLKIISSDANKNREQEQEQPESKQENEEAGVIKIITSAAAEQPGKLQQSKRKISFSTKKKKPTSPRVQEEAAAVETDNLITVPEDVAPVSSADAEVGTDEISTGLIVSLELSPALKQTLLDLGYTNLEEIITRGVTDLQEKDKLTDKQIKELSQLIKVYMGAIK